MKSLYLVARREVLANRRVFWVAGLAGLLPLLLPLSPGLDIWAPALVRNVGALFCAVVEALILSVGFGWSVIGRDLAEGRLSFYFARPIPSGALWAGKFLGAIAVIAGATLTTLLPAVIMEAAAFRVTLAWRPSGSFLSSMPSWGPILVLAAACLFLLAFSHALGIVLRTRSAWAAVHLPLTLAAALFGMTSARRLADNFAFGALAISLFGLACIILILLWAAMGLQMSLGRTDLLRGHRVFSLVLWPALFVSLSGLCAYSHWVDNVDASCLDSVDAVGETNEGTWVPLGGFTQSRMYAPCFLFDTATGRSWKTGALDQQGHGDLPTISGDGKLAIWLQGNETGAARPLYLARLSEVNDKPLPTPISATGPTRMTLSHDGSRVALLQPNLISIYALPGGEYLGGTALQSPGRLAEEVRFLSQDLVRIYLMRDGKDNRAMTLEVLEFDVAAKRLGPAAAIGPLTHVWLPPDPSSTRLAVWKPGAHGGYPALCDLRHAEEERMLLPEKPDVPDQRRRFWSLRFLADGRIVILTGSSLHPQLHLFSASGDALRMIDLPGSEAVMVEEYAPGRLVVDVYGDDGNRMAGCLYLVDLGSGELHRTAERLIPRSVISLARLLTQESIRNRLYLASRSAPAGKGVYFSLVEFDPLAGTKRTLIGPAATWSDPRSGRRD